MFSGGPAGAGLLQGSQGGPGGHHLGCRKAITIQRPNSAQASLGKSALNLHKAAGSKEMLDQRIQPEINEKSHEHFLP